MTAASARQGALDGFAAGARIPLRLPLTIALLAMLWLCALVLVLRRVMGALQEPLNWPALLIAGVVLSAIALVIRSTSRTGREPWQTLLLLAPGPAAIAIAAALTLPNTSYAGLCLMWAAIVAGEAWSWRLAGLRGLRQIVGRSQTADDPPLKAVAQEIEEPHAEVEIIESGDAHGTVVQQMVRTRLPDGRETIDGTLTIAFVPGQRTANAHLAFCPPFAARPEFEFEQISGPDARIKLALLLVHGVRLEARLTDAATTDEQIAVQFTASTK